MWALLARRERREFFAVLSLGLLYGCVLGAQFYVARLVSALGGSAGMAGLLLFFSLLPLLGTALYGQRIYRRWTLQQILRAGLACHAIQLLLLANATQFWMLVPAMLFGGAGFALVFANLLNGATAIVPKTHFAQGIAYLTLCTQLGIGLSSILSAIVEPLVGIHRVFWIPTGLAVIGIGCASYLPSRKPAESASSPARIGKHGNFLEAFILMGTLGVLFGLPLQFVPMWLSQAPGMHFSPAYFLTTSFFSIMLIRVVFSHWLSGEREMHVVIGCFVIAALSVAALSQAHLPWQFAACAVAYGAAYGLLFPSCTAYLIKQVGPDERGAWSNWVTLAFEAGTRCLPAVFGMIADHRGFPLTFLLLAILVTVVGVWHIIKRQKQQRAAKCGFVQHTA